MYNRYVTKEKYVEICKIAQTKAPGSCTSELQLKMNCRPKVTCRIKFGLVQPATVGRPAQKFSFNSLSATIHLYMIRPCP